MCLPCNLESHGKVMEFYFKATVGALFMFDMKLSLFLSFLRRSAVWVSYPTLPPSPLPSVLLALQLKHCVFLSVFFQTHPSFIGYLFDVLWCFPWRFVLTLFHSLWFSVPLLLWWEANNDLFTTYSWKVVKSNDNVSPVSVCVCLCVCNCKRLGPLRALCLPVSFCYWCHISLGTQPPHHSCWSGDNACDCKRNKAHVALSHLTRKYWSLQIHQNNIYEALQRPNCLIAKNVLAMHQSSL